MAIVRSTFYGSLCGFIGVPKGHPAYENDSVWDEIPVHGGWTPQSTVNALTRDHKDHYWKRFDCDHASDYKPYRDSRAGAPENYKNIDFVKAEIERVCDKLLDMMNAPAP